jgi:hypothetical protein
MEGEAGSRPGAHDAPDAVAAHDTIDTAIAHAAKEPLCSTSTSTGRRHCGPQATEVCRRDRKIGAG